MEYFMSSVTISDVPTRPPLSDGSHPTPAETSFAAISVFFPHLFKATSAPALLLTSKPSEEVKRETFMM
jgi:hypothetical protein